MSNVLTVTRPVRSRASVTIKEAIRPTSSNPSSPVRFSNGISGTLVTFKSTLKLVVADSSEADASCAAVMIAQSASLRSPQNWKGEKFNHDLHASFKLEGAHENLSCDRCHPTEIQAGMKFTRFKPIPNRCVDCHGKRVKTENNHDA